MEEILLDILLGLGGGSLIAGIALGVVLTYRGSGIINIGTGAVAMMGGYAYWSLNAGLIYGPMVHRASALLAVRVRDRRRLSS